MSSASANVTTIPLGRRELFAFAERHSSQRLRDYASLSDGVVLCALFNAVFPRRRVRVLWPQSHSVTERTRHNWSVLAEGFRSVRMPFALLDRHAIAENDSEKGFSALVLFYFLYQLTRRADYSAEFAMDVSVELTDFLQSVDSIAVLLLGEAIPWSIVPAAVQEKLREREEFNTPASTRKPSAKRQKSMSDSVSSKRTRSSQHNGNTIRASSVDSAAETQHTDDVEEHTMRSSTRTPASTPDREFTMRSPRMGTLDGTWSGLTRCLDSTERGECNDSAERGEESSQRANVDGNASQLNDTLRSEPTPFTATITATQPQKNTREVILEQQLAWKAEECAQLQTRGIALLAEVANLRAQRIAHPTIETTSVNERSARPSMEPHSTANRSKGGVRGGIEQLIDECLNGTVHNAETGEEVEVHSLADEMSRLIVNSVPDIERQRMLQDRLWTLLSAYHTLESRVQVAADVTHTLQGRLTAIEQQSSEGCNRTASRSAMRTPQSDALPQTILQKAPFSSGNRNVRSNGDMHDDLYSPPNAVKALEDDFKRESSVADKSHATDHIGSELLEELEAELIAVIHNRDATLRRLHAEEERSKRLLTSIRKRWETFASLAHEREEYWRTLCAALHRCERLSYNMAAATGQSPEDVRHLSEERHSAFDDVQTHTDALLAMPTLPSVVDAEGASAADASPSSSICAAMEAIVSSAVTERDAALSQVRELRQRLVLLGRKMQSEDPERRTPAVMHPTEAGPMSSVSLFNSSHRDSRFTDNDSAAQRPEGPSVVDGNTFARRKAADLLRKQQDYERSDIWGVSSSSSSTPAASTSHTRPSKRHSEVNEMVDRHLAEEARAHSVRGDAVDIGGTPTASVQSLSRRLYATPVDDKTVPSRVPRNDSTTKGAAWSYNGSPVGLQVYSTSKRSKGDSSQYPSGAPREINAMNGFSKLPVYPTSLDALLAAGFASPPPR